MAEDLAGLGFKRLYILTISSILPKVDNVLTILKSSGVSVRYNDHISSEPCISDFKNILADAQSYCADCIIGIGGGSVMDVAKLVAAMMYSDQKIASVIGNNRIMTRKT
jgi:alcohol dehydrogenase class IV